MAEVAEFAVRVDREDLDERVSGTAVGLPMATEAVGIHIVEEDGVVAVYATQNVC